MSGLSIDICSEIPLYNENCLPPYDVHPSYIGTSSIIITWSNTGADSYTLYISNDGSTWTTTAVTAPSSTLINPSQTISGLSPNTTYYFKVRTNCEGPINSESAIISILTKTS
jgi:hypothetical protein